MSTPTHTELHNKLFQLSIKQKKWHEHDEILLPDQLAPIDEKLLFSDPHKKRILELGAGWGEFAFQFLKNHKDWNYVCFEIKVERVLSIIKKIQKLEDVKIKIIPINFSWFLTQILPRNAWDLIVVNFPDPWPKNRHHKHRLIQPDFPGKAHSLLRANGKLWFATDYGPYARKTLKLFRDSQYFKSGFGNSDYMRTRPVDFFETRFEKRELGLGKRPYYMKWDRVDPGV